MSDTYMTNYWRGGTADERAKELVSELTSLLNGVSYTTTSVTSTGKTYKKLVIEYADSTDN